MIHRSCRHALLGAGTLLWVITASAALRGGTRHLVAQTVDPLAPMPFLTGRTWLGKGRWPDGSARGRVGIGEAGSDSGDDRRPTASAVALSRS